MGVRTGEGGKGWRAGLTWLEREWGGGGERGAGGRERKRGGRVSVLGSVEGGGDGHREREGGGRGEREGGRVGGGREGEGLEGWMDLAGESE